MKLFLKAKAWHLFVLLFGGMALAQTFFAVNVGHHSKPQFQLWPLFLFMFVWSACFLGWFWSLGTNLSPKVPEKLRMGTRFFRFGLIYALVYIQVFGIFIFIVSRLEAGPGFLLIVPFHLFAMLCIFYAAYFVAKTMKMVESQQAVTFYDYSGPFFLLWFFPLGVWVIQPRINKMFGEDKNTHNPRMQTDAAVNGDGGDEGE